jgi:hypothetical protein
MVAQHLLVQIEKNHENLGQECWLPVNRKYEAGVLQCLAACLN